MTTNVNDFSVNFTTESQREPYQLYCIYDSKLNRYMPPFFCSSKEDALRQAKQIVNYSPSLINKFPDDYSLFYVGNFMDNTGVVTGVDPVLIINFKELIEPDTIQFDEIKKDIQHQNYVVQNLTKDLESKFDLYDKKMKELSILYDKYESALNMSKDVELYTPKSPEKKHILKKLFNQTP